HPEAASRRGISDGDYVYVESPMGRVKAKAKLYEGTVINVVSMPLNIGSRGYEPWETGEEVNPMRLVKDGVDPVDGRFVNGTKVKVYRA
nr:hypothetical protein [Thermoplasmata archaeon]NIS12238.1 hypothetical protein [Thermoplasmata archaeon]NIS19008.1 hypothetical protein [Thermoplasmata archaeon]NIT76061.1 hypothetical protein [Thermoplasmata archaeon]NIU48160.1 hypothetical protein [Thermoplasmata archaeon]